MLTRVQVEGSSGLPSCCVVICTRDRPEQLGRCLQAVLAQCYPQFDVLVVDNASRNARTREVAEEHGVRCVTEPRVGLSVARNRGATETGGAEILVYVDDDALPEPGWLAKLSAEFIDSQVMAVCGRILPTDPNTEGGRMCAAMGLLDGGPQRLVVDRDVPNWFDLMRSGLTGGANVAVRRSAFLVWSGFDGRLGLGTVLGSAEEDYAFFSLIRLGYRVVYTPHAVVRHPFPATAAALQKNHLATITAGVAYVGFLLAQEPECRAAIGRHLVSRLPRSRRRSHRRAPAEARRLASLPCELWAGCQGVALFARFALTAGGDWWRGIIGRALR